MGLFTRKDLLKHMIITDLFSRELIADMYDEHINKFYFTYDELMSILNEEKRKK